MVYNTMNPVGPRPYMSAGQGYKKEEESDNQTQDSLQQDGRNNRGQHQQQNQQNQQNQQPRTIASGRASDVSPKPVGRHITPRPLPNQGATPQQVTPVTQPVAPVRNVQPMPASRHIQPQMMPMQPMQPVPMDKPAVQEPLTPQVYEAEAPIEEAVAPDSRPSAATSNRINIAQILKDFRSTIAAIGTPEILREEVEDYLKEVEENTKGEAPSINLVQTDLLNAAAILDRYISETLNKESKVVSKWLDALFLQRINYHFNDGEINKAFLVKFPEGEEEKRAKERAEAKQKANMVQQEPIAEEPVQEVAQTNYEPIPEVVEQQPVQPIREVQPVRHPQPIRETKTVTSPISDYEPLKPKMAPRKKVKPEVTIIPEDNELKSLFIQAKKHVFAHNPAKAMNMFHRALLRAQQIKDNETESKICLEMGRIYDDNNYVVQALNSYNRSLKSTTDNELKTQAHYSMAQIYDDVNQIEPALNHYMTSVSYAGENDNLVAQSTSLTKIGNIFSEQFDAKAFEFFTEANILISQTDDSKTKGFVSSNTANAFSNFNKPDKALRFYADAVKNYTDARSEENVAENYKAAAELMLSLGNSAKAKVLLRKGLINADRIRDAILIDEINDMLEDIA